MNYQKTSSETLHPETIRTPRETDYNLPSEWRMLFKNKSEMDSSPMKFLISDFLPEGITFVAGLSEAGKTWFCLSMAKAICTGEPFLGRFEVPERRPILYLIPESGERSFRERMERLNIPDDERFLCRTMTQGPIELGDPRLLSAVSYLKPVVFLDTLIRFNQSESENDASQSARCLAKALFALREAGAIAIVPAHHSIKVSQQQKETLENSLRGSGDFGAMADAVYSLRLQDKSILRLRVNNVKARDFEPVPPFLIDGKPWINEVGDFRVSSKIEEPPQRVKERQKEQQFLSAIADNPDASYKELEGLLDVSRGVLQRLAERLCWSKEGGRTWRNLRATPEDQLAA